MITQNEPRGDAAEVLSPCTKICRIGAQGHCVGCGRDLDEITGWARASQSTRRSICDRAAARLSAYPEHEDLA